MCLSPKETPFRFRSDLQVLNPQVEKQLCSSRQRHLASRTVVLRIIQVSLVQPPLDPKRIIIEIRELQRQDLSGPHPFPCCQPSDNLLSQIEASKKSGCLDGRHNSAFAPRFTIPRSKQGNCRIPIHDSFTQCEFKNGSQAKPQVINYTPAAFFSLCVEECLQLLSADCSHSPIAEATNQMKLDLVNFGHGRRAFPLPPVNRKIGQPHE